jgi:spore coat polysaccharide biosynthesis protein SpsF
MEQMGYKTAQEEFWAGEFGDDYIGRNQGEALLASNLNFFVKALRGAHGLTDCLEFGANIGMNLRALKLLYPNQRQWAVEINSAAAARLREFLPAEQVHEGSILEYSPARRFDLVLAKGVLIHLSPDHLPQVYDALRAATGRYLLVAEYYSPTPEAIPYRGHSDRMFRRDFAGEILDRHPDLRLLDYGFAYRRDPDFLQGDITWFLMERHG